MTRISSVLNAILLLAIGFDHLLLDTGDCLCIFLHIFVLVVLVLNLELREMDLPVLPVRPYQIVVELCVLKLR
eukprot:2107422-Amphidinium_carterae.1